MHSSAKMGGTHDVLLELSHGHVGYVTETDNILISGKRSFVDFISLCTIRKLASVPMYWKNRQARHKLRAIQH
eukprot:scaffold2067_cov101-Cylindrotheca_fusiformis.AAC.5